MYKNLKDEYPEISDGFHKTIADAVDDLPEKSTNASTHRHSPVKITVLVAAIFCLLAMTGFAANTVYENFIKKESYKVTLNLNEESTDIAKSIEYVKLNFGYMPDYLNPYDAPYKFGIKSDSGDDTGSGLTFQLFESELAEKLEITYAQSTEECMFGENKGAIVRINTGIESDGDSYDKQFLIYFDDFGYVLRCYVSEKISEEEMIKIANGLYLEESDKSEAFIVDTYIPTVDNGGVIAPDLSAHSYTKDAVVRQLGESFDIKAYNRDVDGNEYTLTVKNIDIRDNVNGLDYSGFNFPWDADMSEYIDENGNLKSYERKTYNYGDGVNSISSLKESETVGRKIVLVDIEVKNNENFANKFYIDAGVCSISGESIVNGVNSFEASYISGQDGENSSYYQIPFKAGENKTVTYGFIIDADADFDDLMFIIGSLGDVTDGVVIKNN